MNAKCAYTLGTHIIPYYVNIGNRKPNANLSIREFPTVKYSGILFYTGASETSTGPNPLKGPPLQAGKITFFISSFSAPVF